MVADELVAERARDAGDAELEDHLLERGGVAGLEALLDEVFHLLARDLVGLDAVGDLLRREGGVGDAVGEIEGAGGVGGVVEEADVDGHFGRSVSRAFGSSVRYGEPHSSPTASLGKGDAAIRSACSD